MSRKHEIVIPTAAEDAVINSGIANDPDTYELSKTEFRQLRPVRGRPAGSGNKVQTTVRFDADILQAFKQGGHGWQTRMNDALREWLVTHPV